MVSNLTQLTVFNVRKNPNDTPVLKLLKKTSAYREASTD